MVPTGNRNAGIRPLNYMYGVSTIQAREPRRMTIVSWEYGLYAKPPPPHSWGANPIFAPSTPHLVVVLSLPPLLPQIFGAKKKKRKQPGKPEL